MKFLNKKSIPIIIFILVLFIISFLWRKDKKKDIEANSKYTIGRITKQLSSLKNGRQWYYEFIYKGKTYEWYRSTHIGYDVNVGDYFLVEFSSKNPENSKILYEYQLKPDQGESKYFVWDTIPIAILQYHEKKNRIW